MRRPSPFLAAILSALLPGLGQWLNGERAKGVALLCVTIGIWFWLAMATIGPASFRSWFSQLILGISYLFVLVPAATDASRVAAGSTPPTLLSAGKPWYAIVMVLVVGAMAVPLVWQSPSLSRSAKIAWAAVGILNPLLALLVLAVFGPLIERFLGDVPLILG